MVEELRILPIQSEVQQKAGHGVAVALQAPIGHPFPVAGGYQPHVARGHVGIQHDRIGAERLFGVESHAGDAPRRLVHQHFFDTG